MSHLETLIRMHQDRGYRPMPGVVMRAIKLDVLDSIANGMIDIDGVTHIAVDHDGDIFCYNQEPQSDQDAFDCWLPHDQDADSEYIGTLPGWMFEFIRPQIYWKDLITEIE